jgi:adenylate kinase
MRVALTGTPGVGKSTVARILEEGGLKVIEVGDLAKEKGLLLELDEKRGSFDVDVDGLIELTDRMKGDVIFVGHLSHLLNVEMIIILRCQPSVLAERLRARGYSRGKVAENAEAEALDVILIESFESGAEVFEIDTTRIGPEQTADAVLEILSGEKGKYLPGHLDWSQEVLGWD